MSAEDCGRITKPLPEPTVEQLRAALAALGVYPCEHAEHKPADERQEVAGLLACLMATAQRHVQLRPEYADTIAGAYHAMRHNFGFPCFDCEGQQSTPETTASPGA